MNVQLPDGSMREVAENATVADVAAAIGRRLAKDALGGKVNGTVQTDGARAIARGGQIIHVVGTCRMGDDAKTSVLNPYCQSWDVKNLFVTDGAPFVSNADKNPTLSILALAWRTTDYVLDKLQKRTIG